jgi:hypothetical protein
MALSRPSFRERMTPSSLGKSVLLVCFGAVAAGALFLWLVPFRGPVHSVESALGSVALRTAGANRLVVIAYVGIGLVRLYLTGLPVVLFLMGIVAALTGRWWSMPAAVLFGAAAASTVTVLTGCSCGSGSAAFLAQRAAWALAGGTAPLLVG